MDYDDNAKDDDDMTKTTYNIFYLIIPPGPPVRSIRGAVPVPKRVSRTVEQIQRERENNQEAYCHWGEHRGGEREIL